MNQKWVCNEVNENDINKLAKANNISNLLASILINRNMSNEDVETFLNPTRNDFHDPFLLPDMNKAVDRIIKAIENKEKTIIYGDYDADGITSIAVLKKFLKENGLDVGEYIPNRLSEGYGLNKEAILNISNEGYTLIITVDCGISGNEEIEYANSLGLETIITDHHEPTEVLPHAIAVVDAKRSDNKYPFNQLAGVGVVFKLIQALSIKLGLNENQYLKYLDIVCVGTISDIVPLVDENRVISKLGLKLINQTKNIGLKLLLDSLKFKKIDSNTISFGVAPRINACGRMGFQDEALKLFLSDDIEECTKILNDLIKYNTERQNTERKIFDEAIEKIEKEKNDDNCIVIAKENWHHGVIGIVSSKVTDIYFKPSILICIDGDEGKGSGRSVPGFDLYKALTNCGEHIEKFGGHSMAVGISIKKENIDKFKKQLEEYAEKNNIKSIIPVIYIDKEIGLKEINIDDIKSLELLEPYGEGNKKPLFLIKNLKIDSIRTLSEGKHIKMTLKQDNYLIDAIGFNLGDQASNYLIGDKIDIVGTLEINFFDNKEKMQINIQDLRKTM